jgi:hypothetical protein
MHKYFLYEELCLLEYNAVKSLESQPAFRRNVTQSFACCLVQDNFFLHFRFNSEDGSDMFLENTRSLSTDYTAVHPRRQYSSYPPLWEPQVSHNFLLPSTSVEGPSVASHSKAIEDSCVPKTDSRD